jgi:hypothetical protein
MIGQSYLKLNEIAKFEKYMNLAHEFRPSRAEPLYKLTKYFRETSKQFKAYQYMLTGMSIREPADSLFIEKDVYNELFYYEKSILDYYVCSDKKQGLRSSMQYFMRSTANLQNVLSNLQFYVAPVSKQIIPLNPPKPFGPTFNSSAVSLIQYPYANVRYVNYYIEDGDFKTRNNESVQTHNALVNLEASEVVHLMDESTINLPRRDHHIRGLEDVRVCGNEFTATVHNYDEHIRVMYGKYNQKTGTYSDCVVLPSPSNSQCEKNWLLIEGTTDMIYNWSPLQIVNNKGQVIKTHKTPAWFSLLRGSAPGKIYNGEMWVLTHFVEYSKPRKYYHCFVKLDPSTYAPKAVSLPFIFKSVGIEYCVSFTISPIGQIRFYASFNETDSSVVVSSERDIEFLNI